MFRYLVDVKGLKRGRVGELLSDDYQRGGRSDLPIELKEFSIDARSPESNKIKGAKRQERRLGV
jgi:hypothetical protein